MMKKIVLSILAGILLGMGMMIGVTVPSQNVMADALNLCDDPEVDQELKEAAGCREADEKDQTIFGSIETIIQIVLSLIGILGVGVVIYGGITYTLSTGDSAKVARAKNIILYGIVGLVVASLAYVIVEFVLKSIFA